MLKRIPADVPESVKQALSVFSKVELSEIYAAFSESNEFIGIGFTYEGKFTKFAEPEKAAAIAVIEKQYRDELDALMGARRNKYAVC